MTDLQNVRDTNPDVRTVYARGDANTDNSFRYISEETDASQSSLQTQRRAALTETNIALDDTKVTAVQGNVTYTVTNPFTASVLTDTRSNLVRPRNLNGSMVGKIIQFNGQSWNNSADEWFTKVTHDVTRSIYETPFVAITPANQETFIFDTEDASVLGGLERSRAIFTDQLEVIKWDRDWSGEGRVIQIQEEADFWTKLGLTEPGVSDPIVLVRFRHYKISNNVTVTRPFLMPTNGPVEFSSENLNNNDLRCQIGAQTLFTGTDSAGIIIRDLAIEDRDGNMATLFDVTQAGSEAFSKVIIQDMTIIDFKSLGTFKGINSLKFKDNRLALYDQGLTLDSCDIKGIEGNLHLGLNEGGAVDMTFIGTNGTLSMNSQTWSQDDNAVAMDIKSTSTIVQGTVTNSTYSVPTGGQFFASGSKNQTDPSWRFEVNGEAPDSNIIGSASFNGNTTETVIAAINTPVAVAGTTVAGSLERFTHNPTGILTYTGTRDITMRVEIRASIDVTPDLETDDITFCIFKNGVAQATTADKRNVASVFQMPTSPEFVSVDNLDMTPGDTTQMFVENNTTTTNILVTDLKLIINK